MKTIEFNPFGTSAVMLSFECDECGSLIESEFIFVPTPDYSADTASDSYVANYDSTSCNNCGKEFNITVSSSYVDGMIEIDNLKEDVAVGVGELPAGELDAIISNTGFFDTFQNGISNLRELNKLAIKTALEDVLSRQIYVGAITCMETYLSDAFINTVLTETEHLRNFFDTFKDFQNQKITINQIFKYVDKADEVAKQAMLDVIYHNLPKVAAMYKDTLKIVFPDYGEINKIVSIRHDLVHRNGKTKEGTDIILNKKMIGDTLDRIERFISEIDEQLNQ